MFFDIKIFKNIISSIFKPIDYNIQWARIKELWNVIYSQEDK
jgi:hypothetical protein